MEMTFPLIARAGWIQLAEFHIAFVMTNDRNKKHSCAILKPDGSISRATWKSYCTLYNLEPILVQRAVINLHPDMKQD